MNIDATTRAYMDSDISIQARNTQTEYLGRTITSGCRIPSYWARCETLYEGGYRTEKMAINAMKRKIDKSIKTNLARH